MIKSHNCGNYIPVTLDDEKMTVEQLKKEREFLQFIIDMKYYPNRIEYLRRVLDFDAKEDLKFRLIPARGPSEGARLWTMPLSELIELKNGISLEIVHRTRRF